MRTSTTRALWMAGLLLGLAAGCSQSQTAAGDCRRDADCDPGFVCSSDRICKCTADSACQDDQFCNVNGYCQKYLGCRIDGDCGDAAAWRCQIGEAGSGQCLCRTDAACEQGEFCNTSGTCQQKAGCILDADCGPAVDWRCRINPDSGIGECFCKTDGACEQGEFCNVNGYCQPNASCDSNEDCPAGRFCNLASGECLCNSEAQTGCGAEEVCNQSGYCQPRPGCYDNRDCEDLADTYCDFNTRTCVPNGTCTSDLQCPLGKVCRLSQGRYLCIDGCNDSADCPLDTYCSGFQCVAGCQADDFCGFAEFCTAGACQAGYTAQTPYCKTCDNTDLFSCGPRENLCLIYPYENDDFAAVDDEYCAPQCSAEQRCPNGFECNSVISVKQTDICHTSADCPAGLPCLKSPEEDTGYCPCTADLRNGCPDNTCYSDTCWMGRCLALSGAGINLPCQTAADCKFCMVTLLPCGAGDTCPAVTCELYDGADYGGCVSGRGCGLIEGVHCPPPSEWP
jgi:hypothetical protein